MCLVAINILLRWQNTSIMRYIAMQFMLDEEKLFILDMVPKRPDTMADMAIAKCVGNR